MAVVGPDGAPTESGSKILLAIMAEMSTPELIAQSTGLALFLIKSGLRDLEKARLIRRDEGRYVLDQKGIELLS
jgi:predicted transcriptional regulator